MGTVKCTGALYNVDSISIMIFYLIMHKSLERSRKVNETKNCNLSTDSCEFPTEKIMGVRNFNFTFKFSPNENF